MVRWVADGGEGMKEAFMMKKMVSLVLVLMMLMLPGISDMIFNNIIDNMRSAIPYMGGG